MDALNIRMHEVADRAVNGAIDVRLGGEIDDCVDFGHKLSNQRAIGDITLEKSVFFLINTHHIFLIAGVREGIKIDDRNI